MGQTSPASLGESPAPVNAPAYDQRFDVHTAADALQAQPPIDWIIDGLFSAGSLSFVVGEPGSKKTWIMLDAAVCVALGADWLGFPTRPSAVLIVDEESGYRRLSRRLSQVLHGHDADESTWLFYVSLSSCDFRDDDDVDALGALIAEKQARLIVIDSFADVMPGADENTVKDVQPLLQNLRRIAEQAQAAIVVIHHNNKAKGYRGSTAIKAAADLMLAVDSKPASKDVHFKAEKARDTELGEFWATFCYSEDRVSFEVRNGTAVGTQSSTRLFVLEFLGENGPSTIEAIQGAAVAARQIAAATAASAVHSVANEGLIERVNSNIGLGRGRKAIFDLTENGREMLPQDLYAVALSREICAAMSINPNEVF